MFSGKKPAPPKRRNRDLSQFGLANIPDDFVTSQGMDDGNDSDLEAELARITGGGKTETKSKSKSTAIPASDLEKMIADSLRDIDSDHDDNDEETVNDPELLSELQSMTGNDVEIESEVPSESQLFLPTSSNDIIDIIKRRIELYKQAETQAKSNGDAAKSRRFNRGLKTLTNQLKQVSLGNSINIDDIPPEINGKSTSPASTDEKKVETPSVPTRTAPLPPAPSTPSLPEQQTSPIDQTNPTTNAITSSDKNSIISQLNARRLEYKTAALNAKRSGDVATALQFLKVVKQFDIVIKMCENEQEVDLSDMPPPPTEFMEFLAKMKENADGSAQEETSKTPNEMNIESETQPDEAEKEPKSVLEALEQRLAKYKSVEKTAKDENNSSKVRRFGRIIKQYEDAIKLYKAGKAVAFEELPVPPGCGPLPIPSNEPSSTPAETERTPTSPTSSSSADDTSSQTTASATSPQSHESLQKQELTTRISGNQHSTNLAEQQMKILIERQKEFRIAAVEAKKAGELEQAKEYLKIYKGFEALLNAASNGLPVDLTSLPVPPSQRESLEVSFAIVNADDCDPNDDISDISIRIEEQLAKQLMMCKNTRDHHKAMGDVAGMNRFENLALAVQKDLDLVRYSKKKKFPLPKFHYEKKSFNIVHCNTDLTDNEVEIVVLRGINYNVPNPKDVDTYVKVEFPYPQDDFFKTKTAVVKNTDSPDYDQRYKVEIQRSNRQCQRIFKRQAVKFEVYSKGGFLRSDTLIGTVTVKLQPLETKCEIHDTFDLMDGRKTVGGKLEVKVRVRNPIYTKQIEHIDEKWLILDS